MTEPLEDAIDFSILMTKAWDDVIDVKTIDTPRKRLPATSRKRALSNDLPTANKKRKDDGIEMKNLCMTCGDDMGDSNPRQLCGKTKCRNVNDNDIDCQNTVFLPPSVEEFMHDVEKAKPMKWKSLDQNLVYVVDKIDETDCCIGNDDGVNTRKAYIGNLRSKGYDTSALVWLPGVVSKKLLELCALPNKIVCIRPTGEKTSKNGRVYEGFETFTYDKP